MRLAEIQEQIRRGEYRVDARAVAEAFLRRLAQEFNITGAEYKRTQE